ncbi:hypothetical protein PsYK624_158720 [Phanerochaete sordida]|uniref:Uncharacterized protein n=1 Tax=Phanerochaete sordida TaxID=48140 RepID=A0A9P3GU53_9APHY|nr:hypothetical protein PsYK624_158720 [Phanerochaete sordida]
MHRRDPGCRALRSPRPRRVSDRSKTIKIKSQRKGSLQARPHMTIDIPVTDALPFCSAMLLTMHVLDTDTDDNRSSFRRLQSNNRWCCHEIRVLASQNL